MTASSDPDPTSTRCCSRRRSSTAPHAPNARFLECAFRQVSITDGQLQRSGLRYVWARDLRLTGTTLAESSWLEVTLIGSALAGVQLYGASCGDVVFSGCKLDSVNFRAAGADRA